MPCSEYQPALSELADGSLTGEARARVEAHVQACPGCRAVLADIRRIRQTARSLAKAVPPDDLWNKVRARIDAESAPSKVVPIEGRRGWFPTSHGSWSLLAAAAVLLVALSTGVVLMLRNGGGVSLPTQSTQLSRQPGPTPAAVQPGAPTTASAHAAAADLVQSVEMELQQADLHYEKAIAGLEQVAREGQGTLDPNTAAVLQKNLGVIDQAIRESRAALTAQPTSEMARVSLFEALRRKVDLLQDTVTLINEMRKGNQAGAARIVGNKG
jgi:anti-sigma factor RsiW